MNWAVEKSKNDDEALQALTHLKNFEIPQVPDLLCGVETESIQAAATMILEK